MCRGFRYLYQNHCGQDEEDISDVDQRHPDREHGLGEILGDDCSISDLDPSSLLSYSWVELPSIFVARSLTFFQCTDEMSLDLSTLISMCISRLSDRILIGNLRLTMTILVFERVAAVCTVYIKSAQEIDSICPTCTPFDVSNVCQAWLILQHETFELHYLRIILCPT